MKNNLFLFCSVLFCSVSLFSSDTQNYLYVTVFENRGGYVRETIWRQVKPNKKECFFLRSQTDENGFKCADSSYTKGCFNGVSLNIDNDKVVGVILAHSGGDSFCYYLSGVNNSCGSYKARVDDQEPDAYLNRF